MTQQPQAAIRFRGDRVRQLRHRRSISATQLAKSAALTTYHVYRLERGERPKTWGITVARLAAALHTSTDYLLNLTDEPDVGGREETHA